MNKQEFLDKQGKGFHIRLFQYINMQLSNEDKKRVAETNEIIFATFPEGKYSIKFNDLVKEVNKEIKELGLSDTLNK